MLPAKYLIGVCAAFVLLALGLFGYAISTRLPSAAPAKISFAMPMGGDFSIPSTQGTFDTRDQRGKVLFVFFGFTHCPHICPTTLLNLREMALALPDALKNRVSILFVSIDPERDTPDVLKKRIDSYKASVLVGGTDTDENLKKITALFGATYSRYKDRDGLPLVEHTSDVFVMNARGEWVDRIPFDSDSKELRHAFDTANDKRPVVERLHPLKDLSVIGRNEDCDIAKDVCEVSIGDTKISLTLQPHPAKQAQPITAVAESGATYKPVLLDMVGITRDMGYLRPAFEPKNGRFESAFTIPLCEVKSMKWTARLIVQDAKGELSAISYSATTD